MTGLNHNPLNDGDIWEEPFYDSLQPPPEMSAFTRDELANKVKMIETLVLDLQLADISGDLRQTFEKNVQDLRTDFVGISDIVDECCDSIWLFAHRARAHLPSDKFREAVVIAMAARLPEGAEKSQRAFVNLTVAKLHSMGIELGPT